MHHLHLTRLFLTLIMFKFQVVWVLFIDLGDVAFNASCVADDSGPLDSKYCADGGVYYAYNFIETGSYIGYVGYPWGGNLLRELDLNLTVSHPYSGH